MPLEPAMTTTDLPRSPLLPLISAACLALICAAPALANAPPIERPPRPQPPKPVAVQSPVEVVAQKKGAPMRIEIPANMLRQGAKGVLGAASSSNRPDDGSAIRTVVAGASLSMALAFGGLWFVRRRSGDTPALRGTRALGLLIGTGLLGGLIASVVQADVPAPVDFPPPPPPPPSLTSQVQIVPRGREIRIHLTQAHVDAIRAEWTKRARQPKRR